MAELLTFALTTTWTNTDGSENYGTKNWTARGAITSAPDEVLGGLLECDTGAGMTLDISILASVNYATIKNEDATNFVTVTWDNANGDTQTQVIAAGKFTTICDLDPSATFKVAADTASCLCEIQVDGS